MGTRRILSEIFVHEQSRTIHNFPSKIFRSIFALWPWVMDAGLRTGPALKYIKWLQPALTPISGSRDTLGLVNSHAIFVCFGPLARFTFRWVRGIMETRHMPDELSGTKSQGHSGVLALLKNFAARLVQEQLGKLWHFVRVRLFLSCCHTSLSSCATQTRKLYCTIYKTTLSSTKRPSACFDQRRSSFCKASTTINSYHPTQASTVTTAKSPTIRKLRVTS